MMNKKSMEAAQLVAIMIVLVSFVLIAGTVTRFLAKANDKEAEALCHDSIALRARTQVNIESRALDAKIKTVPVLCKTIDKKITGNREEIKQQIADKIARCWWMFGEGKHEEILGNRVDLAPALLGTDNQPNKCFNCYTLLIDQDTIEGGNTIDSQELLRYMSTHTIPNTKDVPYLDYIQSYGGAGMLGSIIPQGIEPRNGYTVSILPKNKDKESINWVKAAGITTMVAVVIGTAACATLTGGLCAVIIAVAPAAASVGGGLTASGLGYEVLHGDYRPGPNLPDGSTNSGLPIEEIFEERVFSSIYVSDLNIGEQFCGSGDLAGQ